MMKFSGLGNKRIPTLVGVGLLVVALVISTVFFQQGLGIFSPRATAETTPKQVRITNVTDSSFSVSFLTESEISGAVKFGTAEKSLKQTATDHRDGLSGTIGEYKLHYINVRGLQPNTAYYYVLNTGGGALFDNNGTPFKIVTARRSGSPTAAKTVYGTVSNESGAPAEGAVVYIAIEGAGEMSSLVANSGSWAIPLSNARTVDGSEFAKITDETQLKVFAQGPSATQTATGSISVAEAQPIPTLVFGQTAIAASSETPVQEIPIETAPATTSSTSSNLSQVTPLESPTSSTSTKLTIEPDASDSAALGGLTEVDLTKTGDTPTTVTTGQPVITGKAAPNVTVTIEVHSDTEINQQLIANEDGTFSLDIASLSQTLEPGEHTVTYSYTDPITGQPVTETETFFVEPQSSTNVLAQATPRPSATPTPTPSPTPFGTDNPFPIGGATKSAQSSSSATSTNSGKTGKPSTASGMPVSGSVGTTMALVFGGLFFIISGGWSYWASKQYAEDRIEA
jgi:hypothetical protein